MCVCFDEPSVTVIRHFCGSSFLVFVSETEFVRSGCFFQIANHVRFIWPCGESDVSLTYTTNHSVIRINSCSIIYATQ